MKTFPIKAIFLDRDGTIVEEPPGDGSIDSLSKLKLLPNAVKGLKKMSDLGYTLFVVSNQDGINKGRLSINLYNKMNSIINDTFSKSGIKIEKWLVCPHTSEENCKCRKPKTEMIDSLKKGYTFDFKNSYVVGDREKDIILAKKLGMKGILVKRNEKEYSKIKSKPDFLSPNLFYASKKIKPQDLK